MPFRLLAQRHLVRAMILTFLFMGTFMALPYFNTELFQRIYRFSPLETGFAFLVPCIAIAVGTQIGGRLASRVGVRPLLLLGLSAGALGAAMVAANITPDGRYTGARPRPHHLRSRPGHHLDANVDHRGRRRSGR